MTEIENSALRRVFERVQTAHRAGTYHHAAQLMSDSLRVFVRALIGPPPTEPEADIRFYRQEVDLLMLHLGLDLLDWWRFKALETHHRSASGFVITFAHLHTEAESVFLQDFWLRAVETFCKLPELADELEALDAADAAHSFAYN